MSEFWTDRRVLVTGCTGLVGSWTTRALLERGAHVVGLVRDSVTGSELVRGGLIERIDVVRGGVESEPLLHRVMAEYEIQTVFHLAAQTIVGIANRCPLSTFESNIKGTWCLLEAARRCGHRPDVVVASSPSLVLSNRLTFEAWIRPFVDKCLTIISRGDGGGASDYIFEVGYDGSG